MVHLHTKQPLIEANKEATAASAAIKPSSYIPYHTNRTSCQIMSNIIDLVNSIPAGEQFRPIMKEVNKRSPSQAC